MSLGTRYYHNSSSCSGISSVVETAMNTAYANGIFIDAASGNEGNSIGISFPACQGNVTSVGATYDEDLGYEGYPKDWIPYQCIDWDADTDEMPCYSNIGPNLDLLAPGSEITSTQMGGGFVTYDGTSMAAPHVAGAAALLLEKDPNLSPEDILSTLQNTGVDVIGSDANRIDVEAALNSICTTGDWQAGSCGGGTCEGDERYYTRITDPDGCAATSKCEPDPNCDTTGGTPPGISACDYEDENDEDIDNTAYLGTGNLSWFEDASWAFPTGRGKIVEMVDDYEFCVRAYGLDRGARFFDFNGDGREDLLDSQSRRWINNGHGWTETSDWPLNENIISFGQQPDSDCPYQWNFDRGVRFEDINGDHLTDVLVSRSHGGTNVKKVYLNNGKSFVEDNQWTIPEYFVDDVIYGSPVCYSRYGVDQGVRVTDVNGDGFVDIIKSESNNKKVYLNNGTGWALDNSWTFPTEIVDTFGGDKGVRVADVNGDGFVDVLKGITNTWLGNSTTPYLLKNIKNRLGGNLTISYMKSTDLNSTGGDALSDLGFNIWVVSNITLNNGLGGAQNTVVLTAYNYSGGLFNYSDKEFKGFNYVEEIAGGKKVRHYFHQDSAREGREYRTETLDLQGNLGKLSLQSWSFTNSGGFYIVQLVNNSENIYLGSPSDPFERYFDYQYDSYGNLIRVHTYGDLDNAQDDKYEYFNYVVNQSSWIVNTLKNYSLFDSTNSVKLRETLYSYDGRSYGAIPTKGSLTRKEDWLSGGSNPVTHYGYDSYGNEINETDPNGNIKKFVYGIRDTTYTFVNQQIDAKNNVKNYHYDLGTGNILWETETNGFATNYTYDTFGRIVGEISRYDSIAYPTKVYNYSFDGTAPERIKISSRETGGNSAVYDQYYFYDGLGRTVQMKTEAENSKQIISEIYYDLFGRVIRISNPYLATFSENYATPNATVPYTNYSYDILNRVILAVNPDGTINNATYKKLNITTYDENGNRFDKTLNAYGKIVEVREYDAGTYVTRYRYNAAGDLLSIIDAAGNLWNYTYDTLGRKTSIIDPDTGLTNYTYDAVGNLISQVSGGGNLITGDGFYREYNQFGQLVRVRSGNTAGSSILEEYTYDPSGERIKTYNVVRNETIYTPFKEFMMVVNTSGRFNYTYVYEGDGILVARINPDNSKWYYHSDHEGSTTLITNQSGEIVEEMFYLPYGGVESGGSGERKLYEGEELDLTGQYYFGARYYDSGKAMFISPDSLIPDVYDPQQLNIYAFERRNPYGYTDPSGNQIEKDYSFLMMSGIAFKAASTYLNEFYINPLIYQIDTFGGATDREDLVGAPVPLVLAPGAVPLAFQGTRATSTGYLGKTDWAEDLQFANTANLPKTTSGFASQQKLGRHYGDHGKPEFGFESPEEYQAAANTFYESNNPDILTRVRTNGGDIVKYNYQTNEYLVVTKEGVIKTFFKPGVSQAHQYSTNFEYFVETSW